jgi:hypothetical protein
MTIHMRSGWYFVLTELKTHNFTHVIATYICCWLVSCELCMPLNWPWDGKFVFKEGIIAEKKKEVYNLLEEMHRSDTYELTYLNKRVLYRLSKQIDGDKW